jgi:hypothetical protein
MVYPVTVDALHTVFSPYGFVQKIAIFEKNGQHQVPPSLNPKPYGFVQKIANFEKNGQHQVPPSPSLSNCLYSLHQRLAFKTKGSYPVNADH